MVEFWNFCSRDIIQAKNLYNAFAQGTDDERPKSLELFQPCSGQVVVLLRVAGLSKRSAGGKFLSVNQHYKFQRFVPSLLSQECNYWPFCQLPYPNNPFSLLFQTTHHLC
jgi:hypothetical protein